MDKKKKKTKKEKRGWENFIIFFLENRKNYNTLINFFVKVKMEKYGEEWSGLGVGRKEKKGSFWES